MERITKASLAASLTLIVAGGALWAQVTYLGVRLEDVNPWQLTYMLVGAPAIAFAYVYFLDPMRRRQREAWQALPAGRRAAITAILVALVIASNVVGVVVSTRMADDIQGTLHCEDGPLYETGNGTVTATLPGSTALHPLLASDASTESSTTNTFGFTVLNVVPTWTGPAIDITLSVKSNGEWFHGGTYEEVASGTPLAFDLGNPDHDAIKFSLRSPPVDEDTTVNLSWTSLDRTRC